MAAPRKAVILLSGGLDSATALAIAKQEGFELYALSFRYGQRHEAEIAAAQAIARQMGVKKHLVADIDLRQFGASALTSDIPVPKRDTADQIGDEIPVTYVPARNTIFLSFALAWAETLEAGDLFIGVNAVDYSGYPDCRPQYVEAYERMANLATKAAVEKGLPIRIRAPLVRLRKAQIIRRGLELGIDYGLTSSCYDPAADGAACGHCDACLLRLRGFAENQVQDPARYRPP
jgi:7-cyano-7-deazaguanine synthase